MYILCIFSTKKQKQNNGIKTMGKTFHSTHNKNLLLTLNKKTKQATDNNSKAALINGL